MENEDKRSVSRNRKRYKSIKSEIELVKKYAPDIDLYFYSKQICIFLKGANIIPKIMESEGLDYENVILSITIEIGDEFSWKCNPSFNIDFDEKLKFGSNEVSSLVKAFFSQFYVPKNNYETQHCVILGPYNLHSGNLKKKADKFAKGVYSQQFIYRAMSYSGGDINNTMEFICGNFVPEQIALPLKYDDCHLIYLILEIVEKINYLFADRYKEEELMDNIPKIVNIAKEILGINITYENSIIKIPFSSKLLSREISKLYGYAKNEEICIIEIEVNKEFKWNEPPTAKVYNKDRADFFIGKNFIQKKIGRFFNKNYKPSEYYNSIIKTEIKYSDCPIVYLILEICDELSNIQNRCIVCGRLIPEAGIKLDVCQRAECIAQFQSQKTPIDISSEIRRDPDFIEFLLTMASCAVGTKYLDPKPAFDDAQIIQFFETLSPVEELAKMSDDEIKAKHGETNYEILKFFIRHNRAHFITLKGKLAMDKCEGSKQYLMVMQSPEREAKHRLLKEKNGCLYLWHGSSAERWYKILHTGLLNLTGTSDQANGKSYGEGIYLATHSAFSYDYTNQKNGVGNKKYKGYRLPDYPHVLALTENAKTSRLVNKTPEIYTQCDVESCNIRCVIIANSKFKWDTVSEPPVHIPTVDEALKSLTDD